MMNAKSERSCLDDGVDDKGASGDKKWQGHGVRTVVSLAEMMAQIRML